MNWEEKRKAIPYRRSLKLQKLLLLCKLNTTWNSETEWDLTEPAIRYWAVLGMLMRGRDAVQSSRRDLLGALRDKDPSVKIIAAEALSKFGNESDLLAALETLIQNASIQKHGVYVSMLALNAIDSLGDKAKPLAGELNKLPQKAKETPGRMWGITCPVY